MHINKLTLSRAGTLLVLDDQSPPVQMHTAQGFLGHRCIGCRLELQKRKAPVSSVHLLGQPHPLDPSELPKQLPQLLLGGLESQVLDRQLGRGYFTPLGGLLLDLEQFFVVGRLLRLGYAEKQPMPIEQLVVHLPDGLHGCLFGLKLHETVPHRPSLPTPHYFGRHDIIACLQEETLERCSLSLKIEVLDVDHLAQFLLLPLLSLSFLLHLGHLLLAQHPLGGELEEDEAVLELVLLQVTHCVLGEGARAEPNDGDCPVGSQQYLAHHPVEPEQLLQVPLLSPVVEVLHQQGVLRPQAALPVLLDEVEADPVGPEPLLGLEDDLALGQGHLGGQPLRKQDVALGGVQFLGHPFEEGVGVEEERVPGGLIVQPLPHLLLFLLLEGSLVLGRVPVQLLDLLLVRLLLALSYHRADVLQGRLHVDDPPEHHSVVESAVRPQRLLRLQVVHETVPLVLALLHQRHLYLVHPPETRKSATDGLLVERVGQVGHVKARSVDLKGLGHELFVALREPWCLDLRGFVGWGANWHFCLEFFGVRLWLLLCLLGLRLLLEVVLVVCLGHDEVVP